MSAQEGRPPHPATTHDAARIQCLERALHTYGVLTHERLYKLSGADHWVGGPSFDAVLHEALRARRVRDLGGVLFEAAP
jgi:hypothetical protein